MASDFTVRMFYSSPLSRPGVARFAVIFLSVLVVVCTGIIIKNLLTPLAPDALRVFFLALLWSALLSVIPLAIVWFLDRREQESTWLYALAVLWGAFIATGIAQPINVQGIVYAEGLLQSYPALQQMLGEDGGILFAAPLVAPIVEETTKGMGLLLLFWLLRAEFDSVRDGFIYGALVGIGFNLLESAVYVAEGYAGSGVAPWGAELGGRHALFGFAGHALFTSMFGMGLGLARQTTRHWLRYTAPITGWLLAYTAHFINNGITLIFVLLALVTGQVGESVPPLPTGGAGVDPPLLLVLMTASVSGVLSKLPFLLIVGVMLYQSGVWERQVIREELSDETLPTVTPKEYETIKRDRIFRTRRISAKDSKTWRAIVQAQNELAIRKWRVKHLHQDCMADPLVHSWREEIAQLRQQLTSLS